ncbi:MAG TPA: rRNA methyltransferase, partial [Bacteroidia bacterium]|nr:rRNA methyltransferase [Bacteroidia bacterium]
MQNWPESFLHRMKQELGDEFHAFVNSLNTPAPVSIRVNPFKKNYTVDSLEKVPWSVQGYYLNERPAFIFDPAFHAGMYYVQEASSMFLEAVYTQVFSNSAPAFVLDA